MLLALAIPISYSLYKKSNAKEITVISICLIAIVIFYPVVEYLSDIESYLGYLLGKFILFTLFPLTAVLYMERTKFGDALKQLGVRKKNIGTSIFLGIAALTITLLISLLITWGQKGNTDLYWNVVMFFEAFNEEFLFRGFLFLYLWKIMDVKVAYLTSVAAFILAHPQNITSLFMISTAAQGVLLAFVTWKTENIIGPWISHGLNRIIVQLIRAVLF